MMSDFDVQLAGSKTSGSSYGAPVPPGGVANASSFGAWSFRLFVGHNTALIGGGLYLYKPYAMLISGRQAMLFYNNTAYGGGAMYLQDPAVPPSFAFRVRSAATGNACRAATFGMAS